MAANSPNTAALVFAALASATLGLAPFAPEPHVVQKLRMLVNGELTRAIDIGDLVLHGAPWLVFAVLLVRYVVVRRRT